MFVINRGEWERGKGGDELLWSTETRSGCCLGLAALVEGVTPLRCKDYNSPVELSGVAPLTYLEAWVSGLDIHDPRESSLAEEAILVNDSLHLPESEREDTIASIFKRARGWDVEFEG